MNTQTKIKIEDKLDETKRLNGLTPYPEARINPGTEVDCDSDFFSKSKTAENTGTTGVDDITKCGNNESICSDFTYSHETIENKNVENSLIMGIKDIEEIKTECDNNERYLYGESIGSDFNFDYDMRNEVSSFKLIDENVNSEHSEDKVKKDKIHTADKSVDAEKNPKSNVAAYMEGCKNEDFSTGTTCTLKYVKTESGSMQCLRCKTVYGLVFEFEEHLPNCGVSISLAGDAGIVSPSSSGLNEQMESTTKLEPGVSSEIVNPGNSTYLNSKQCPSCGQTFSSCIECLDHKYMCRGSVPNANCVDIKLETKGFDEYSNEVYTSGHVTAGIDTKNDVQTELGITGIFYNTGDRLVEISNMGSSPLQHHCPTYGLQFGTKYDLLGHSNCYGQRGEVGSKVEGHTAGDGTVEDYSCEKCEKVFKNGKVLGNHRRKCCAKKKNPAKKTVSKSKKIPTAAEQNCMVNQTGDVQKRGRCQKCSLCKQTFKSDTLLVQHIMSHHVEMGERESNGIMADDLPRKAKKRKQVDNDPVYMDEEDPKSVKIRRRSNRNIKTIWNMKTEQVVEKKRESSSLPVSHGNTIEEGVFDFDKKLALRLKIQRKVLEKQKVEAKYSHNQKLVSTMPAEMGLVKFYHCFFGSCGKQFLEKDRFLTHIKEEVLRQNTLSRYYISVITPRELKENLKDAGLSLLVFSCNHEQCSHMYFTLDEMKGHVVETHSKYKFPCGKDGCSKGFNSKYDLKSHIIVDHAKVEKSLKSHLTASLQETVDSVMQQKVVTTTCKSKSKKTITSPDLESQKETVKIEYAFKSDGMDEKASVLAENEKINMVKNGKKLKVIQETKKEDEKKKVKLKGRKATTVKKRSNDLKQKHSDTECMEYEFEVEENHEVGNDLTEQNVTSGKIAEGNERSSTSVFNGELKGFDNDLADNLTLRKGYSKENLDFIEKEVNIGIPEISNEDRIFEKFILNKSEDIVGDDRDVIDSNSDDRGHAKKSGSEKSKGETKLEMSMKNISCQTKPSILSTDEKKELCKTRTRLTDERVYTKLNGELDSVLNIEKKCSDDFSGIYEHVNDISIKNEADEEKKCIIRRSSECEVKSLKKASGCKQRKDETNRDTHLCKEKQTFDEFSDNPNQVATVKKNRNEKKSAVVKNNKKHENVKQKKQNIKSDVNNNDKSEKSNTDKKNSDTNLNPSNSETVELGKVKKKKEIDTAQKMDEETVTVYSCKSKDCNSNFVSQDTLREHVRSEHLNTKLSISVYKCFVGGCIKVFTLKESLFFHVLKCHASLESNAKIEKVLKMVSAAKEESGYMCHVCELVFGEKMDAEQHVKYCQRNAYVQSVLKATGARNVWPNKGNLPSKNKNQNTSGDVSEEIKNISKDDTQNVNKDLYGQGERNEVSVKTEVGLKSVSMNE